MCVKKCGRKECKCQKQIIPDYETKEDKKAYYARSRKIQGKDNDSEKNEG